MLVCVLYALKWLNWFREITLLFQKGSMALRRFSGNSVYHDVRKIACYLGYLQ